MGLSRRHAPVPVTDDEQENRPQEFKEDAEHQVNGGILRVAGGIDIIEGHKAQDGPGQSHTAGQQSHNHHGDDGRGPGIGGNAPEHRADQASGQGQGHPLQYRQDHPLVLYLTQGQVAVLVGKRTHEPQIRHRDPGQPGAVEPPALGDGVKAQGCKDIDGQSHQGHHPAAKNIGDEVQDPAGIVIV